MKKYSKGSWPMIPRIIWELGGKHFGTNMYNLQLDSKPSKSAKVVGKLILIGTSFVDNSGNHESKYYQDNIPPRHKMFT